MNMFLEKIAKKEDSKKDPKGLSLGKKIGVAMGLPTLGNIVTMGTNRPLVKLMNREDVSGVLSEHDVSSYVNHKNLHGINRVHDLHPSGTAAFSPKQPFMDKPTVFAKDPSHALHEYGHAHQFGESAHVRQPRFKAYAASARHTIAGNAGLLGAAMGTSDNEHVRKAAPYAAAAVTAPMLYEEATATLSPYKHLLKTRGAKPANHLLKRMAPGFASYAVPSALAVGAAVGAKKIQESAIKKNEAKALLKKASYTEKDRKASKAMGVVSGAVAAGSLLGSEVVLPKVHAKELADANKALSASDAIKSRVLRSEQRNKALFDAHTPKYKQLVEANTPESLAELSRRGSLRNSRMSQITSLQKSLKNKASAEFGRSFMHRAKAMTAKSNITPFRIIGGVNAMTSAANLAIAKYHPVDKE